MPTTLHMEPETDGQFGSSVLSTAWTMCARNADMKMAAESLQSLSYDVYTHEKLRCLANTDGEVCIFDVNSITCRYNNLFNKLMFQN